MGTEANKQLIRRFVDEIFVKGRVDAVDELVASNFVSETWSFHENGTERLKEATARLHASLSDVAFSIEDLIAEGDRVVTRVTSSATPTGDFMGVPASGKRYTIGEIHIFQVRDGRVVAHWHQHDALGLMKQLGALPG